jgi:hypothetical protein
MCTFSLFNASCRQPFIVFVRIAEVLQNLRGCAADYAFGLYSVCRQPLSVRSVIETVP